MKGKFYEIPEGYNYSISLESKLIRLTDDKATEYLSLASKNDLKQYLPKNIDFTKKVDCLAIAGQSFLANKLNLNDDAVETETAIRLAKLLPYSFIDANHYRDTIIGVILNATYTDEETHEELTEEQASQYTKPFAVTIGGLIWKLANEKITRALKDEKLGDSLYFSWELAYKQRKLIEIPKDKFNLSDGFFIENDKIQEYSKFLKSSGGSGILDNGNKIGTIIMGDCLPLGVGIVEHPAGQLDPLLVDNQGDKNKLKNSDANIDIKNINDTIQRIVLETIEKQGYTLKQNFTNTNSSVINFTENQNKKIMDKINSIKDITDDLLKETKASVVVDFVADEIRKRDEKWQKDLDSEKNAKSEAELKHNEIKTELEKTKEELQKIQNQLAAQAALALYNQRMTYFDDTYELSKEERQAIAEEINVEKNPDKDAFDKIKTKLDVFLKEKSKVAIQAKKDAELKQSKASVQDDNTQNVDTTTVVNDALKNGQQTNAQIPNAQGGQEDWLAKYREAFKPENCLEIRK